MIKKTLFVLSLVLASTFSYAQASENEIIEYIKSESIGGKLDFNKKLAEEGKQNQLHLYDGVAYNTEDYAILLWSYTVKTLGVKSFKAAAELWESIYEKELSDPDKKAMKKGLKIKIE